MLEYYGDNVRWFIATVINASPPPGFEGRMKIRIHGVHSESTEDIPEEHLPWAQCLLPTTEGGISGVGRIPRLQAGALVLGLFMDGKSSQVPIIFGSLPSSSETPSEIQGEDVNNLENRYPIEDFINLNEPNRTPFLSEEERDRIIISRKNYIFDYFNDKGYTEKQSTGILNGLTGLGFISGFRGGDRKSGAFGIGAWKDKRFKDLKNFNNNYQRFTTQVNFINHELNSKYKSTQAKLRKTEKISGEDGSENIFKKYYLKQEDAGGSTVNLTGAGGL